MLCPDEPHRVDPGPDAGGDAAGAACRVRQGAGADLSRPRRPGDRLRPRPADRRPRPRRDLPRLPAAAGLLRRLAHLAARAAHGDAAPGSSRGRTRLPHRAGCRGGRPRPAPPDPVAAIAIFRRIGGPERVRLLVEGESMINDGTALVLYSIALGVATGGAFSFGDAALEFVAVSVGGIAIGLAVGFLSILVIRRQTDASLVVVLTLLTAYGAYIGAEELGVSGILAAVVAGLYGGYQSPRAGDADTRLSAVAFWHVLIFTLEMPLFVLPGLQLPGIVDALEASSSGVGELLGPVAAIAAASIAVRLAFVFAMRADAGETLGERFAVGWSGMRGAVSLAAALAVGLDVPGRPQIIFLTFSLILATLVGQGLSLPFVIRKLRLEEPRRWSAREAVARMEAAQAALDRIDEIESEERAADSQLKRLRDLYRARFKMCQMVLGGEDQETIAREQRLADYGSLRRELIGIEREILLDLRGAERLRNATMRQIERDLDLEEARIRS